MPMWQLGLRICFRVEGNWWNAYVAKNDTMTDALKIGSILMRAVYHNEERKKAFMELMKSSFEDIVNESTGLTMKWELNRAPEHERAGNA